MRIALLLNAPYRLVDISIRYEPYVEGLQQNGVDAITICPARMESEYSHPVLTFDSEQQICNPDFWDEVNCDAVAMISWHRMTNVMKAIREAGAKVLAIADSDGRISPRHHPWSTFRYMTYLKPNLRQKLGAAKHWLLRFLIDASNEHRALIENTSIADVVTLPGAGPVDEFRRLLKKLSAGEFEEKTHWLPYPVAERFCTEPVESQRRNRVVAVGRWDSPQKNAPLLAATIRRVLASGVGSEFIIIGRGADRHFSKLARSSNLVQIFGIQPPEKVLEFMREARSIIFSSRWEGSPVAANEMLALGGTVIGTPIPSLAGITADRRFGRVTSAHSASALAAAVIAELRAWESGVRDPQEIASHWRALVRPSAVAARALALLDLAPLDRLKQLRSAGV